MRNTVTQDLIKTIISEYPVVPSWKIHCAGRQACLSGSQRLRDLKKKGLVYSYDKHYYNFSNTPLLILYSLLENGKK